METNRQGGQGSYQIILEAGNGGVAVNLTTSADINNMRQNHPELVVDDLKDYVPPDVIRWVLKTRGINKWLRVRRLLIQLKVRWKDNINELQERKLQARRERNYKEYYKLVGYIEALTDCRQQVRALCHSPRDIDFPLDKHDFGIWCSLPGNFPQRPHKRWFCSNRTGSKQ